MKLTKCNTFDVVHHVDVENANGFHVLLKVFRARPEDSRVGSGQLDGLGAYAFHLLHDDSLQTSDVLMIDRLDLLERLDDERFASEETAHHLAGQLGVITGRFRDAAGNVSEQLLLTGVSHLSQRISSVDGRPVESATFANDCLADGWP